MASILTHCPFNAKAYQKLNMQLIMYIYVYSYMCYYFTASVSVLLLEDPVHPHYIRLQCKNHLSHYQLLILCMWTTNTFQHQDFVDLQANVNIFSLSITFASFKKQNHVHRVYCDCFLVNNNCGFDFTKYIFCDIPIYTVATV